MAPNEPCQRPERKARLWAKQKSSGSTNWHTKAKNGPLTPEEQAERDALRKEYLEAVRASLRAQMDNIVIVEPDGTRHGLGKPREEEEKN